MAFKPRKPCAGTPADGGVVISTPTPPPLPPPDDTVINSIDLSPSVVVVGSGLSIAVTFIAKNAAGLTIPSPVGIVGETSNPSRATWGTIGGSSALVNGLGSIAGATTVRLKSGSVFSNYITVSVTVPVPVFDTVITSIDLTPTSVSLPTGTSTTLAFIAKNAAGQPIPSPTGIVGETTNALRATWGTITSSSATVNGLGGISGSTTVRLRSGAVYSNYVTVDVVVDPPPFDSVIASIDLLSGDLTLLTGQSATVNYVPRNAAGEVIPNPVGVHGLTTDSTRVVWGTVTNSTAVISAIGSVAGSASIRLKGPVDGPVIVSNSITVNVTIPIAVFDNVIKTIQLTPTSLTLPTGQSSTFSYIAKNAAGQLIPNPVGVTSESTDTSKAVWGAITGSTAILNAVGSVAGSTIVRLRSGSVISNSVTIDVTVPAFDTVITSLEVSPPSVTLNANTSMVFSYQAKNSAGQVIPSPSGVVGESNDSSRATWGLITGSTATLNVFGSSPGSTVVKLRAGSATSNLITVNVTVQAAGPGTLYARATFNDGTFSGWVNPYGTGISVILNTTGSGPSGNVARYNFHNDPAAGQIDHNLSLDPPGVPPIHAGEEIWFGGDFYIDPAADMIFGGGHSLQRKFTYFGYGGSGFRSSNFVVIADGPQMRLSFAVTDRNNDNRVYQSNPEQAVFQNIDLSVITLEAGKHYRMWQQARMSTNFGTDDGVFGLWIQKWTGSTPPASKGSPILFWDHMVWLHPDLAPAGYPLSEMKWDRWSVGEQINTTIPTTEYRLWKNIALGSSEGVLFT